MCMCAHFCGRCDGIYVKIEAKGGQHFLPIHVCVCFDAGIRPVQGELFLLFLSGWFPLVLGLLVFALWSASICKAQPKRHLAVRTSDGRWENSMTGLCPTLCSLTRDSQLLYDPKLLVNIVHHHKTWTCFICGCSTVQIAVFFVCYTPFPSLSITQCFQQKELTGCMKSGPWVALHHQGRAVPSY